MYCLSSSTSLGESVFYHNIIPPFQIGPSLDASVNQIPNHIDQLNPMNKFPVNNFDPSFEPSLMTLINSKQSKKSRSGTKNKNNNNEKESEEKGKMKRRKFTEEEDKKLKKLVEEIGSKKWEDIAKLMPGRTGRQCRDRYQNYLIPGFFNGQWSQQEDDLLKLKYLEYGSQWSEITKFFSNRSANSLKNRWNYFVSRQITAPPNHGNGIILYRMPVKNNICEIKPCIVNNTDDNNNDGNNDDENLEKNDVIYESIINYTNSLDFFDIDSINENEELKIKDEYSFPYVSNDILI